jgi:hypothetical protein
MKRDNRGKTFMIDPYDLGMSLLIRDVLAETS